MVKIKFTDQSISDLEDIANYISIDSKYYASLQVEKFFRRAETLEKFPLIGRVVPELKIESIRELIEGNYRIIYRIVTKDEIHILTIYHSRRLLQKKALKK